MDTMSELIPFLEHERDDVRLMAAESLSQVVGDPSNTAALIATPHLLPALLKVAEKADDAAVHATAALVNLCADHRVRPKLLVAGAVKVAVAGAVGKDTPADHVQYSCMLLANLTQDDEGRARLVKQGASLFRLFGLFVADKDSANRKHLSSVVPNCFAHPLGRRTILLEGPLGYTPAGGTPALLALCRAVRSCSAADPERRLGLYRALRNLCFEVPEAHALASASASAPTAAADGATANGGTNGGTNGGGDAAATGDGVRALLAHVDELVAVLAAGLAVTDGGATSPWPDEPIYSDAEVAAFGAALRPLLPPPCAPVKPATPAELPASPVPAAGDEEGREQKQKQKRRPISEADRMRRAREANPFVEPQHEARLAATEALLLLAGSEEAAGAMRAAGLYPLLRQASFVEWHEPAREANANLVRVAGMLSLPPEPIAEEEAGAEAEAAAGAVATAGAAAEEEEESRVEEVDDDEPASQEIVD